MTKAIRECSDPDDEDVVRGVLEVVLARPAVSKQAEQAKYGELLAQNGYASVAALALLTRRRPRSAD